MTPIRAILFDAAGTLLQPARPVAESYWEIAREFGGARTLAEVEESLGSAMAAWAHLRSHDPAWTRYWHAVVHEATGVDDTELTRRLYAYFDRPQAWTFAPGAEACVVACRRAGYRVGVVSNWDSRLRRLLTLLTCNREIEFDTVVISAEEGYEKPDPRLFLRACERLKVTPTDTLMIGDSLPCDVEGATRAGCRAWYFGGPECPDFETVQARLLADAPT